MNKEQHVFTLIKPTESHSAFSQGVPLPKGMYSANESIELFFNNTAVPCATRALALWPDRSIRWLMLECVLPPVSNANTKFYIRTLRYNNVTLKKKWVHQDNDQLRVGLKDTRLSFDTNNFLHFTSNGAVSEGQATFEFEGQALLIQTIRTQHQSYYDSQNRPLFCDVTQEADFITAQNQAVRAKASLRCYYHLGLVQVQVNIHNPQAVVHHGGKWDLGNEHSLALTQFQIRLSSEAVNTNKATLYAGEDTASIEASASGVKKMSVTQFSSGGERWDSPNHKRADNRVALKKRGAQCLLDGAVSDMLRPEPAVFWEGSNGYALLRTQHFWQKFPSQLKADGEHIKLGFTNITDSGNEYEELQAGESKSHNFDLLLLPTKPSINIGFSKAQIKIPETLLEQCSIIPWFNSASANDDLQLFINAGINAEHANFFKKREALDEFGWRNFGDIYADHEAVGQDPSKPFVSHYNNQYDPLHGFLKQWMLSGDSRWQTLADDLFDHIVNIDIYETDSDKPEYNKGLFWHTDHYVEAQTATHRTYSKHQQANVYMDHAGGGGPGAHHCYTSGLALYYWLNGSQRALDVLLGMTQWMSHIYEGDKTLLGLFLRIKNANYLRVPFTNKLALGSGTGVLRNVFTNKYPLDRGTGNYVNTLLDAFEVTHDFQYLSQSETVILNTICADDDLSQRNFSDIENTWFYIVFLQAVAKHLFYAANLSGHADKTRVILRAFLHYAQYVRDHETLYLDNKQCLEYPNDTWTAQDVRKVHVLACASALCAPSEKDLYSQKANALHASIVAKLKHSDEAQYTRILALLMQNYGAVEALNSIDIPLKHDAANPTNKVVKAPSFTKRLIRFVTQYSLKRERQHLVARLPKLKKYLGQ
ncbi:hypothetical protein ACFO4O_08215 [Glaciecola siphonariae]|uniref:PcRGLX/YetA-like N-terminal RIFT barrel domain-containing protein n=1 Tax=Glaciecola siphonariae TaxID=521012 RepID=A0ABV9LWW2_9ALTE